MKCKLNLLVVTFFFQREWDYNFSKSVIFLHTPCLRIKDRGSAMTRSLARMRISVRSWIARKPDHPSCFDFESNFSRGSELWVRQAEEQRANKPDQKLDEKLGEKLNCKETGSTFPLQKFCPSERQNKTSDRSKGSSGMLGHGSNPNNHHQGCLDVDKIPIIIIKDACTLTKSQ